MKKLFGQALIWKGSVWFVVLAAVVLLSPIASSAQKPTEPAPVAVAVIVQTSQFEDQAQKDRLDTARDLKQLLAKKKTVRLVDTSSEATVVVEVLGRGEEPSARSQAYADKVVHAKLTVGDYSTDIEGRYADGPNVIKTTWAGAAVEAAGQIDKWIKTNLYEAAVTTLSELIPI